MSSFRCFKQENGTLGEETEIMKKFMCFLTGAQGLNFNQISVKK